MKGPIKISHHRRMPPSQQGEQTRLQSFTVQLFSLRKNNKHYKVDIDQLLLQDNKPIFSLNPHPHTPPASPQHSPSRAVSFNVRKLLSRSAPSVPPSSRENSPRRQLQKPFPTPSKDGGLSKMRQDFLSLTEQLGMIANLREQHPQQMREAIRSRKDRVKLYMNSFMTSRHKGKREKDREQKIQIFPWEKSFETEEDNFMQN